jgi:serine protease Do
MLAMTLRRFGAVVCGVAALASAAVASAQTPQPTGSGAIDRPGFAGEDFSALAKRLMPSVVNISTRQTVSRGDGLPSFPPGSPLNEFNDFFGRGEEGGMRRQSSLGSGFIIDSSGYVVTNNHVIEDADEIDVILSDGTVLAAKLAGRDTEVDLALLKVTSKTPLTPVPFGNSDTAQVGEWVVAIGNPFGLGGTVTAGIISARNRDISAGSFDDFIQTDAAINRGNSGGPLFNLRGEVIGINTAIFSPGESGGSVGVGFSVPSNLTKAVVAQLRQYGSTRRGSLGVTVRSVDQAIAESYGLSRPEGAIITGVTTGGPAAGAGLKVGDLITAFNNQPIRESRDLSRIIGVAQVGAQISVRYIRGGKTLATSVKLAAPTEDAAAATEDKSEDSAKALSNLLGVSFGVIEDTDRRRLGLPNSVRGVIVRQIESGSDALGKLRVGQVVTEVNFQPVTSPEQAIESAEAARSANKPVLLQVWGENEVSFVSVRTK